jgi:DNA-binding transcriptional LysR family regulator
MDRFDELQTFVSVVDSGSFSRAAERTGVAKSAVSRRLSALESRLGARLLNRTTRSLSLTESGRSFYQRALRLIADLEEAEAVVSSQHATLRGTLRIAAPLSFGLLHLGPAIQAFARIHPAVRLYVDFNDRQVDLVEEGFDLSVRIARLQDSSLIARRLTRIREVVCASPGYFERHGEPRTAEELASHATLRYTNLPDAPWRYRAPDGNEGAVRVRSEMEANNGDFLRDCAIAGHGIIRQPTFIVYRAIEQGLLKPVLTDYTWPEVNAYALYPSARHLSHRVRTFVDFLQSRFGEAPYWDRCLGG